MKLPFRYQFTLAPFIVVAILAVLVAYTLFEISNINANNEAMRQWQILGDRMQTTISTATLVTQLSQEMSLATDIQQDDRFLNYLEQIWILADNLLDQNLLSQLPSELRARIKSGEHFLREPEQVSPVVIDNYLRELLPPMEYQYKIFVAQRRSATIDNHQKLVVISSRLTNVLLFLLILCIVLAMGLTFWGLRVTRKRIEMLSARAQSVCTDDQPASPKAFSSRDEIDDLDICLANMTARLLQVVGVENVLRGVESERRRMAMDMHDGVLADLTAINRRLDSLNHREMPPMLLKELRTEVDDVIQNLRGTIDDLHPQVLETLGLEAALRSYLTRHGSIAGFPDYQFGFEPDIDLKLAMEHKINLFRIISEAINNILKHAHADRIEVDLRFSDQQLVVTVEDNGVGIPSQFSNSGHGFANISERARLIGAMVHWRRSRFSSGTCFELNLPMQ